MGTMRHIHVSEVDRKLSVCFDTGLDPRSFARTKMSQCLIEPGYIVCPDGTSKVWKASGVNELDGYMRVWGLPFPGKRLDLLLNEDSVSQQTILQAVVFWVRAKLLLGETDSANNPGAAFISCEDNIKGEYPKGSVFFTPESLSQRCLYIEGANADSYNCPDLTGIDAAAFCAGTMLYKILAHTNPYAESKNIYQDMREGVFLPPHLAVQGLNKELCTLIQAALLLPVANKRTVSGINILSSLLNILMLKDGEAVEVSSLLNKVSDEEKHAIEKNIKYFLTKQNIVVKTKRFYSANKPALFISMFVLAFIIFVGVNTTRTRERLTTAGLSSEAVIIAYYEAFSNLDHTFMGAILYGGADRSDLNTATIFFATIRQRQMHERSGRPPVIPARVWQDLGGELPAEDVFGVTDLLITHLGGSENEGQIVYRADYILWLPMQLEQAPSIRSDEITLRRIRGNWRISQIYRTIRD